ncbi:MAG: hypothetical protein K6E19_02855 [Lachnospiraceae bacterium]|nr:hypothetical protein [Lachnospiraceae bacterium]
MTDTYEFGQAMRELFSTNAEKLEDKITHLDDLQSRNAYDQQHQDDWKTFTTRIRHRKELRVKGKISEPKNYAPEAGLKPVVFEPVQEPKMGIKNTRRKKAALKQSKPSGGFSFHTDYTAYIAICALQREEQGKTNWEDKVDYSQKVELAGQQIWKVWNPDMFEPTFFGKNYEYVSREVEKMNFVLREFREGTEGFNMLTVGQKERMRVFVDTAARVNDCYEKALAKHYMKLRVPGDANSGVVPIAAPVSRVRPNPGNVDAALDASREALRDHVANQDKSVARKMADTIQAEFTELLPEFREDNVQLQEALKKEYPLAKGNFFSEINYADVQKYMSALDDTRYLENVEKNRAVIDKMLADFVNMNEVMCEYQFQAKAYVELQSRFRDKYGADTGRYSADDRLYNKVLDRKLEEVNDKKEIYAKALEDMALALNHLIMGKQELNDSTYLMLEKYGVATPQEKVDREVKAAGLYQQTYVSKHANMEAAIRRVFPDNAEAKIEEYTKGTTGRAIMLIKPGDDGYNDDVIRMVQSFESLKGAVQTRKTQEGAGEYNEQAKQEYSRITSSAWEKCSPILQPKLTAILDADLSEFINLTPAQLVANQQKFLDLVMASMMISDLCKAPSDVEGLTMQEKLLGKPEPSEKRRPGYNQRVKEYEKKANVLSAKKTIIEGCRVMARGYALAADGVLKVQDLNSILSQADLIRFNGDKFTQYTDPAEKMAAYGAYQVDIGKASYQSGIDRLKEADPELLRRHTGQ